MKTLLNSLVLVCLVFSGGCERSGDAAMSGETGMSSASGTAYYINPVTGDDANSGLDDKHPWKTFANINKIRLTPGDTVYIVSGGSFDQTLRLSGSGTASLPVEVIFAAGRYDFYNTHAIRRKYNISNTNASPEDPKAIGILFDNARHVKLSGDGSNIVCRGKMIQVCIDHCEDITVSGLSFDYHRPTVVEFQPVEISPDTIDLKVHPDSVYRIENGHLSWHGEGWSFDRGLGQALNLKTNEVWRMRSPLAGLTFEELRPGLIRGHGTHRMKKGFVYQIRDPFRDYAAVFTRRSKNIAWKNMHFKFMHGMGLVNQFSENLTFDHVTVAPDKDSGRTTAAWADCIQVSGCRGKVLVKECVFSGAHDDAINIHGTHLRVVEKIGTHQVKVQFVHKQTYGFLAFNPGDEITFVRWDSLATYAPNTVKDAVMLNSKDILLTLKNPYPADINENDVIENVTWTPEVEIRSCDISRIPTRGFLITTRRKVVVENNRFHRTHMSAILLEDDAHGWFESGCIRDMTIRGNTFIECAEPVVNVNPQNSVPNDSVHQNIRVVDNTFWLKNTLMLRAKSTKGLTVSGNTVYANTLLDDSTAVKTSDCADVTIKNNTYCLESQK